MHSGAYSAPPLQYTSYQRLTTHPTPTSLLVQSFHPGSLPLLPDGLEGEEGGQQTSDPGL